MFGPDYLCICAALAMLATVPVVLYWPERREEYGSESKRETLPANFYNQSTRKE